MVYKMLYQTILKERSQMLFKMQQNTLAFETNIANWQKKWQREKYGQGPADLYIKHWLWLQPNLIILAIAIYHLRSVYMRVVLWRAKGLKNYHIFWNTLIVLCFWSIVNLWFYVLVIL